MNASLAGRMMLTNRSLVRLLKTSVAVVWALFASSLLAQPPERRGEDSERSRRSDDFYEAMREAQRRESSSRELLELLLRSSEIQKEIAIDEVHLKELKSLISDAVRAFWDLRRETRDAELSKDELVEKIVKGQRQIDDKITKLLVENSDYDRLLAIYVQARNYRAAAHDDVAAKIGLAGDDLKRYRESSSDLWHALMKMNRWKIEKLIRERKEEEFSKVFKEAEDRLDELLSSRLSEEQREKLEELKGEKFAFPLPASGPPPRGEPGGPPPRRGGESGPRRNGGDGKDKPRQGCCFSEMLLVYI